MLTTSHVSPAAQIGPPGFDYAAMARALADHLPAAAARDPRADFDSRPLGEALSTIERVVLARKGGLRPSTVRVTALAFRIARETPAVPLCFGTEWPTVGTQWPASDECAEGPATYARGKPVHLRCSPERAHRSTRAGAVTIERPPLRLGDVPIRELVHEHVTACWNAFAGPSLSALASAFVARLEDGERLGFAGLARWRAMWPSVPQSNRRHIEVSDEIHREALRCLEWAVGETEIDEQTLRLIALAMHCPGRLDELCSLRVQDVDLRAGVLRLVDSKTGPRPVPLTTAASDLLRTQLATLRWDATWVWPCATASGHARADTVSKTWLKIRRIHAEREQTPEAAALLRWRAHDFRGALATQALEHGASIREVQRALGHADVRTTERYDHGGTMRGPREAMERAVRGLRGKGRLQ